MKPVMQTLFRPSEGEGAGNCLAASLASLLELDLDAVPNFAAIKGDDLDSRGRKPWLRTLEGWLAGRGYALVCFGPEDPVYLTEGTHLLAHGQSPRGDFKHTVVGVVDVTADILNAHDPHPDGSFLAGPPEELWLVVRR